MLFEKKGCVEFGHSHEYDHTSFVATGSVEIQVYDESLEEMLPPVLYKAPSMIFIKRNTVHQIISSEDNTTVHCIHALRDINDTIIDPCFIPIPEKLETAIDRIYYEYNIILKSPVKDDKFSNKVTIKNESCIKQIGE